MTLPRRPYLTTRAHEAFSLAHELAYARGEPDITSLHVAIGIIREGANMSVAALSNRGIALEEVLAELEAALPAPKSLLTSPPEFHWTAADDALIEKARIEARVLGHEHYGCEHVLLAILRDEPSTVTQVLKRRGLRYPDLRADVVHMYSARLDPEQFDAMRAVFAGDQDYRVLQIIACETELRVAQLAADVATLDRLLSEDLLFTGPDGQHATKAQDLAAHRSGLVRFRSHEPEQLRVRIISEHVAVAALRARLGVEVGGQLQEGQYRYTRVWARESGHSWRVVGGHVSEITTA